MADRTVWRIGCEGRREKGAYASMQKAVGEAVARTRLDGKIRSAQEFVVGGKGGTRQNFIITAQGVKWHGAWRDILVQEMVG